MTPKEKADELVNKFKIGDVVTEKLQVVNIDIYSKRCALIAVDEIIKDKKMFNQISVEYWEDVKQEIEKI